MDACRSNGRSSDAARRVAAPRARRRCVIGALPALLLLSATPPASSATLWLTRAARSATPIVLAGDAIPAEATAARELGEYLERVTGADFPVIEDAGDEGPIPSIHVGPTRWARARGGDPARLGAEQWVIRTESGRLLLHGGRPRGTLYAVYRFLEDHVGVRWWTPYAESVPRRENLGLPRIDRTGAPAFAYRDVAIVDGPRAFAARRRLNGEFTELPLSHGGAERYGPPYHVHTFYLWIPPERYFESHPEFFSEIAGFRVDGEAQLCLTDPGLERVLTESLLQTIRDARAEAAARGAPPPRLFNVSQNDWRRPCECVRCRAVVEREGAQSGPILDLVNRLADAVGEAFPDVLVDTLAYDYSFAPPRHLRARDNVTLRVAGLRERDFSKPASHAANREYRTGLEAWSARTRHLRVWDYTVVFGDLGELPLPNLGALADDYRLYRRLGVEGVFVQHPFPVAADLRDLKLWVQTRLLEEPGLPLEGLIREFTEGYYGPAAKPIRRYVERVRRAAERHPSRVGYAAAPADYAWLRDLRFLRDAHRLFDAAERRAGAEALRERVRHARLSLDRATLVLWSERVDGSSQRTIGQSLGLSRVELVRRYRATWLAEIDRRYPVSGRPSARAEVEREIAYWDAVEAARRGDVSEHPLRFDTPRKRR